MSIHGLSHMEFKLAGGWGGSLTRLTDGAYNFMVLLKDAVVHMEKISSHYLKMLTLSNLYDFPVYKNWAVVTEDLLKC